MATVKIGISLDKNNTHAFRAALGVLLANSICKIKFKKTDGEERLIKCTLKTDLIPPLKGSDKPQNLEVLPVYELADDKSTWKSFRIDSLISIKICE